MVTSVDHAVHLLVCGTFEGQTDYKLYNTIQ